ncbi:MAG: protein YgfX [Gammaproteobacteria bacterium]
MIAKPFQPLVLKSSKRLAIWLILVHTGAAICVAYLPCTLIVTFLLEIICFSSLLVLWRRHIAFTGRQEICKITRLSNGDWGLVDRQDQLHRCRLLAHSVVVRSLMLLHFATLSSRRRISLVLPYDALNREDFRRLQVHILTQ